MHTPNGSTFQNLGIAPRLLEALEKAKFVSPTPIQEKSIPVAIEGKDVIGIAQTGTGKTLAFGIPMLQRLASVKGRGLILVPTRELALQVEESLMRVGRQINLRTAVLIGGASMNRQMDMLQKNPHVIVATPGRLIDHMETRRFNLGDVRVLILDEADRMLDMGFMPQIQKIINAVPKERQTLLFSATMPQEIVSIASKHMIMPVRVEIARAGTAAEKVSQEMFVVSKHDKPRLLEKMLGEIKGTVLVFTRTKFGAKRVARDIRNMGHTSAEIHSNRSLAQRREALEGFKSGKYRVLVATDIAARGIDVKNIEVVINFDLPDAAEDYVHRIGRTGRAGTEGRAISFATPDQGRDVRTIEAVIRKQIPLSKVPSDLPPMRVSPRLTEEEENEGQRGFRGGQRGFGSHGGRGGQRPMGAHRGAPRHAAPYARREERAPGATHQTPTHSHAPAHTHAPAPHAHARTHVAHDDRAPRAMSAAPKFNPHMNTYERPQRPQHGGAGRPFGRNGERPKRSKSMWIKKKDQSPDRPSFKPKKGPRKFFGNPFGGPVKF